MGCQIVSHCLTAIFCIFLSFFTYNFVNLYSFFLKECYNTNNWRTIRILTPGEEHEI